MASINQSISGRNQVGKKLNLDLLRVNIEDTDPYSKYFTVNDFEPILTSGKNAITINGSDLLKSVSPIRIEVLDLNRNPLYTEIAKSPNGVQYREGVSTIVAIHVYEDIPTGLGTISIVGTTKEGQTVRWKRTVNINSRLPNITKIRFYNPPEITVTPLTSSLGNFNGINYLTYSGSIYSTAVIPDKNTDFNNFDSNRNELAYKLIKISGLPFSSSMEGNDIYVDHIFAKGSSVPYSFTSSIKEVVSDTELYITRPFTYPGTTITNIDSASYTINYVPYLETNTIAASASLIYLKSIAEVTLSNLETFSGNAYRFKLYRKSFNSNVDTEIIADEIIQARELLVDHSTRKRMNENIGYFYNNQHINKYWGKNNLTFNHLSDQLIDGANIQNTVHSLVYGNVSKLNYLIAKQGTFAVSASATYYPFNQIEYDNRSGNGYDSNFVKLYPNVTYVLSANVIAKNNPYFKSYTGSFISGNMQGLFIDSTGSGVFYANQNITTPVTGKFKGLFSGSFTGTTSEIPSSIKFYLTGSTLDYDVSTAYDGYGILINDTHYTSSISPNFNEIESTFTVDKICYASLVIVPDSSDFIVSKVSIQPYQAFSFSPGIITTRIPFPVEVQNERFHIRAELLDIDSKKVAIELNTYQFFDEDGVTLLRYQPQVANSVLWQNVVGRPSDSILSYPTLVGNIVVTGNLTVNGQGNLTASYAQGSNSSSYSTISNLSLTSTSASYASTTTLAQTASFINYSSTWSDPNLLRLGNYRFWLSESVLRAKNGIPSSISDGNAV